MSYREFAEIWGVQISRSLLRRALTHRSFAFEHDEEHNERLEFLGDSILGMIVAEKLYKDYPNASEGDMSRMKTYAVSERGLSDIARELNLGQFIRLGKGEDKSGGRDKDSILSDTLEALIAATYLQHGMETTCTLVSTLVARKLEEASVLGPNLDWQTSFEEIAHRHGMEGTLQFEMTSEGPDHARVFTAVAHMAGRQWGSGTGSSQKNARRKASEASYWLLVEEVENR